VGPRALFLVSAAAAICAGASVWAAAACVRRTEVALAAREAQL
jgi:hypothetical protein